MLTVMGAAAVDFLPVRVLRLSPPKRGVRPAADVSPTSTELASRRTLHSKLPAVVAATKLAPRPGHPTHGVAHLRATDRAAKLGPYTAVSAADRREPGIGMIYTRPFRVATMAGATNREPVSTGLADGPAPLLFSAAQAVAQDLGLIDRLAQQVHQPEAPTWRCGRCSEPWPCAHACRDLLNELGWARLVIYVTAMLQRAAGDLADVGPAVLWTRFVGWTDPAAIRDWLPGGDFPQ